MQRATAYHPLVQKHDANGLRDNSVDLACRQDVFLDLLVLHHALHYSDAVAQVRVRLASVGLVNKLLC